MTPYGVPSRHGHASHIATGLPGEIASKKALARPVFWTHSQSTEKEKREVEWLLEYAPADEASPRLLASPLPRADMCCWDTKPCLSSILHFAVPTMNSRSSKLDRLAPFISPILRESRCRKTGDNLTWPRMSERVMSGKLTIWCLRLTINLRFLTSEAKATGRAPRGHSRPPVPDVVSMSSGAIRRR